jgi:SAM-dependent methyltransferase
MSPLAGVRRRLRLRRRFRDPTAAKRDAELRWWLEQWDPVLREGGFNPGDAPAFLDGEEVAPTYLGRRWQQARAEVRRVLREAAIGDDAFFDGKVVLDIGPGPLGFPDACPARVSVGVDPLAEQFAQRGLLLPNSPAVYLATGAERIPLVSSSVDVVVARTSLDHVDDPAAVLAEVTRLLRPGGTAILNFDVGHAPTVTEPHTLTLETVRRGLSGLTVRHEARLNRPSGSSGDAVVVVARRPHT